MLDRIIDKHPNSIIAVCGSGPTVTQFTHEEDFAIALNGAMMIKQPFEYFAAFDRRIKDKPYFHSKPHVTRLLGSNIAPCCKLCYPSNIDREITLGSTVLETNVTREPDEPHCRWDFEFATETMNISTIRHKYKGKHILYSSNSIAGPGFQLAYLMGAKEIHLYGIGLMHHDYFEGHCEPSLSKDFKDCSAVALNRLIKLAKGEGIIVKATHEPNSRLVGVEWL
jgi:hypothetical protein